MPHIVSMAIYCLILNFYESFAIYAVFYSINLLVLLCIQSVAQISAILSPDNVKLAWLYTFLYHFSMFLLGNIFVQIKDFHYALKMASSFSYPKYAYNTYFLIIYGFNRCSDDQFSGVLLSYDLDDQDFWPSMFHLIVLVFSTRVPPCSL